VGNESKTTNRVTPRYSLQGLREARQGPVRRRIGSESRSRETLSPMARQENPPAEEGLGVLGSVCLS
jgi:hypothetical protein